MSADLTVALPDRRDYGGRARRLFERCIEERIPVAAGLELTHRCNLACRHCYVNLPAADREAHRRELSTEAWKGVLDEIAAAGVLYLTLTGGEPLLRADFAEIYRHAHQLGFVLTVYSNATLITDRVIDLFSTYPPARGLEITQYGFTEATYDHVADAGPGQYRRFQRGFHRLRSAGVRVSLKTVAIKSTAHEVAAIRDFARAEGLGFRFDAIISPRIDGGRGPLAERLSPAEVAAIEDDEGQRQAEFAEYCRLMNGATPADDHLYQCGAGLTTFTIDPYGYLHPCELSRRMGWNVVERGFLRGWSEAIPALRDQRRTHSEGCGSCATAGVCSNCVGMAELEGRSPDEGSSYFCETTDARNAMVLGPDRPRPNGLVRLRLAADRPAPASSPGPIEDHAP